MKNHFEIDIHSLMILFVHFFFQVDADHWPIPDIRYRTRFIHFARALGPHRASWRAAGSTRFAVCLRCRWNWKGLYKLKSRIYDLGLSNLEALLLSCQFGKKKKKEWHSINYPPNRYIQSYIKWRLAARPNMYIQNLHWADCRVASESKMDEKIESCDRKKWPTAIFMNPRNARKYILIFQPKCYIIYVLSSFE